MLGDLICDLGEPWCLNIMFASDLHNASPLLLERPGRHWHADAVEDRVRDLGVSELSDQITEVMRHRRKFHYGFPQVTIIDNISCPVFLIAQLSSCRCVLRAPQQGTVLPRSRAARAVETYVGA